VGTVAALAWVRWYTTLDTNARIPQSNSAGANLANWTFENNLNNSLANNMQISWSGVQYTSTPYVSPVAKIRLTSAPAWAPWVSVRAGHPASLDAADSYSVDGLPLTYSWSQTAGPSQVIFDDPRASAPVVRGFVFGTYTLRLVVRDNTSQSQPMTLTFGAVATDDEGVVVQADYWADAILGPQLRFGASPWPWFDERQLKLSDFYAGLVNNDPRYVPYWNGPVAAGTVSLTANSAVVTGSGTAFRSVFGCNNTDEVLIRWNGGQNRLQATVVSCASDTEMTISPPWNRAGSESGLSFSRVPNDAAVWYGGSTNNNYYDNVMAFYTMYFRSGNEYYLEAARKLADIWWTLPAIDQGRNHASGYSLGIRLRSLTGLFLRGLDGRPEILDAMRPLWEHERGVVSGPSWPAQDIREHGYEQFFYSLAARFDRDPELRSRYASFLLEGLQQKWTPSIRQSFVGATEVVTWIPPVVWAEGTVSAVNGQSTVTGSGVNWNSSSCQAPSNWFYLEGDTSAYQCEYVSSNTLRLFPPYQGASVTSRRFQQNILVGGGTQPFMQGIAGQGILATYQVTGNEAAKRHALGAAQWLRLFGYRPRTRGLYYGRVFPQCEPSPDAILGCTGDNDGEAASRFLSGEVLGFLGQAYLASKDESLKRLGDVLVTANFSKAGFEGPMTAGGMANENFEDNALVFTFKKARDFGFWFGFGAAPSWLAARLGGVKPENLVSSRVSADLASVPGAVRIRLTVTAPSSAVSTSECAETPCSVNLDRRQGQHWIALEYLSASGEVLAKPDPFLLDPGAE
jgi:hypothetical protein